jgi:hypothetical protein
MFYAATRIEIFIIIIHISDNNEQLKQALTHNKFEALQEPVLFFISFSRVPNAIDPTIALKQHW